MQPLAKTGFDVASALILGRRETQEDALATDFPLGSEIGLAVLADGMGGHAAGDVASKIVVTEVYADLKFRASEFTADLAGVPDVLRAAVSSANDCIEAHVHANPATGGMGATVVALVLNGDLMSWLSVGDSPLYLWRDGELIQLNEDHSLAPQIDYMVASGQMDPEVGRNHPDRNALTSVLMGQLIERIDCPDEPLRLHPGDLVLVASDGLQFIGEEMIAEILEARPGAPVSELAEALLTAVRKLDHPDQDNVSFALLRPRLAPPKSERMLRRERRRAFGRMRAEQAAQSTPAAAAETRPPESASRWSGLTAFAGSLRRRDPAPEAGS